MEESKLKSNTQNPQCPSCKSNKTCIIFWGYPKDMEWYLEALAKKEIAFGGCCVSDNDPKWECNDCGHRWGKREDDEDEWEITFDEEFPYTETTDGGWTIR